MDPEVEVVTGDQPAPEASETASPAEARTDGETKPEGGEAKPAKTFSQEELDAIVAKRLARERRNWERTLDQRQAPQPKVEESPPKPTPDKYETTEAYVEALTDWKAREVVKEATTRNQEQQRQHAQAQQSALIESEWNERLTAARDSIEDFDDVAFNPRLPITEAMAATLKQSERGPEVLHHLGKHPEEAARIARLSPFLQAKELGRIEAKLPQAEARPTGNKTSQAPEPMKPVTTGQRSSVPSVATTDPRSTKAMSTSEWIAAERERQRAKLRAQGYT